MYALPVDVFRILAGAAGLAYFVRLLADARDFSHSDGLIDHRLIRRIFPPTRMSLFHPGVPDRVLDVAFAMACVSAVMVIIGYHTKAAAAVLFVVAVSTYRWNVIASYVDDAIMHLVFLWLLLLPVGHTLTLPDLVEQGSAAIDAWRTVSVPGSTIRAFLANMALVYVVAGLYKFTSPMWRNGTALHAILRMPLSRFPDFWQMKHYRILRVLNYAALVLEPLFALMYVVPAGSVAKWFFVLGAVCFHVGIIATLKIPFANFAMLGAIPIALAPELRRVVGQDGPPAPAALFEVLPTDVLALGLVGTLALMVLWEVARSGRLWNIPLWKTHMAGFSANPMCIALWLVGVYQSYRLFDWVDQRNFHVSFEVRDHSGHGSATRIEPEELFPRGLRHLLLQSYLLDNVWMRMSDDQRAQLRTSLLTRHAQRYARRHPGGGDVEVFVTSQRITSDNLELERGVRKPLMRFTYGSSETIVDQLAVAA
jgi:hypothetical protein